MKKKIAIVTLYDNKNFGNKVQNYAVKKYFEEMGADVTTIIDTMQMHHAQIYFAPIKRLKRIAQFILQKMGFNEASQRRKKLLDLRRLYIKGFSDDYLMPSLPIDYRYLPNGFASQYDYFVTGSDQVWHGWRKGEERWELEYFLLMFAEPSQRLTMAPSFGFNEFPEKLRDTYKKGLEGFEYLSVREERGAELIKELTGKDATVLLDPTMLIDTSEWLKILKKPVQFTDENYIFVYSLGGFQGEIREKTCGLANELGLQVIDIMDIDSDYYIHTRPDEFLYWIYHAKLVVTDSFHASVFSILFNRPFVVTERSDVKGMGSRIDTLFSKFALPDRRFETLKEAFASEAERQALFDTPYENVPAVLEKERQKAAAFYAKCFRLES